jgi:hypothetical protein
MGKRFVLRSYGLEIWTRRRRRRTLEAEDEAPDDGERLRDAAENGTTADVEALLASGCDVNAVDKVRQKWTGSLKARDSLELAEHGQIGWTALHKACFASKEETVHCLLDAGAAIEALTNVSEPSLQCICALICGV